MTGYMEESMVRTVESAAREAKLAELKRLIVSGKYETLETLEDAVEAFLWGSDELDDAEPFPLPRQPK